MKKDQSRNVIGVDKGSKQGSFYTHTWKLISRQEAVASFWQKYTTKHYGKVKATTKQPKLLEYSVDCEITEI